MHSPCGPPALGRAAIVDLHAVWTEGGSTGKRLDVVQAGGSGDLAWCLAEYSEGETTGNGTSLMVFQRGQAGDWQIRMCSMNQTGAEAGEASA